MAARTTAPWAESACLLAGLLTPLAFHPFGTLGFEGTKSVLVRLLALVVVLGWVARRGWDGRLPLERADLERLVGPPRLVALALAGYVGSLLLASALSIAPATSVWGSYDRLQGVVTALAWLTLGIAAAVAGRIGERRQLLLTTWLLGSLPVCLYALAQRLRLDPIEWLNQPLGTPSTLGSSTALGAYLAMLLPVTLARMVDAASKLRRDTRGRRGGWQELSGDSLAYAGWLALAALQGVGLLLAEVRGAFLGAGVGIAIGVAALGWRPGRRGAPLLVIGAAMVSVAGVAVGSLLAAGLPSAGPTGGVSEPADTATEDYSVRQRVLIWRATLETVASAGWRAAVGFGPETQALALEARFPAELAARYPDARFDRAHNLIFDALLTTGVLGVILLAVLLWALSRSGIASLGVTGSDRSTVAGLLGALAANLVAGLYAFDSIATGVLFAMLAGLLVAPLLPPPSGTAPPQRPAARPERVIIPRVRLRVTAALAAAALGLSTLPSLIGPLVADLHYTRALALRAAEAPALSLPATLAAIEWAPSQDLYLLALGHTYQEVAETTAARESAVPTTFDELTLTTPAGREGLFQAARLALERAAEMSPLDPYNHLHLARFWATWGQVARRPEERTERLARSAAAYDLAIGLSPNRATFYDEAGLAFLLLGRPDDAERRYAEAEARDRPSAERLARLGDAAALRGDSALARARYLEALELYPRSAPAEHGLARLARDARDLPESLEHLQRAARFQMREWIYRRDLALVHRELEHWSEALSEARAARRLAPAWEWDDLTALIDSVQG